MNATPTEDFARCICPKCGGPFEIPKEYVGTERPCPHCGESINVTEDGRRLAPLITKTAPEPQGVTPLRVKRSKPSGYTLVVAIGACVGGLMMFAGLMEEGTAKTVYQQIPARILTVCGVITIGMTIVVEVLSTVARYLWEVAVRLESIEGRLVKPSRKE